MGRPERSRVVVVTGGSRGLGLAIVKDLLDHRYSVATCAKKITPEIECMQKRSVKSDTLFWHPCAIGDEKEEKAFFDAALEWAGEDNIYGLVNNAGIAGEGILASFPNINSSEIINVNLMGSIRMARLVLQTLLKSSRSGRIINISSIIGGRGYTGLAVYSASKAGMDGLTRSLAREVGRRNITVNSVAPGYLETSMSSGLSNDQRSQIVRRTPLNRLGQVSDIVPVVRFLLSDEASFITGQTLVVDGGITC
jgi:3-oxoacyl-[acyl-carrier protein] reductase